MKGAHLGCGDEGVSCLAAEKSPEASLDTRPDRLWFNHLCWLSGERPFQTKGWEQANQDRGPSNTLFSGGSDSSGT